MKIPKYIIETLARAKYSYDKDSICGYTIAIEKRTPYTDCFTLRDEAKRIVKWANREYQKLSKDTTEIATVNSYPVKTSYKYKQYATVTIFDPIMKHLEKYIGA